MWICAHDAGHTVPSRSIQPSAEMDTEYAAHGIYILFIIYTIRTLPVGSVRTEAWDIYCRMGSYWTATVRPAMRVCTCLCFLTNWNLFVDVSESARSSVLSVVALCGAEMRLAGARTSSRRRRTSR